MFSDILWYREGLFVIVKFHMLCVFVCVCQVMSEKKLASGFLLSADIPHQTAASFKQYLQTEDNLYEWSEFGWN